MNGWVLLVDAARVAGRSRRTLQTWVRRGVVSGACRIVDRKALVWLPDVIDATWTAARRQAEPLDNGESVLNPCQQAHPSQKRMRWASSSQREAL